MDIFEKEDTMKLKELSKKLKNKELLKQFGELEVSIVLRGEKHETRLYNADSLELSSFSWNVARIDL